MTEQPAGEVQEFAHRMFELARGGAADELSSYVDAGLPVNLTNDKGDCLLMLAAYHDHLTTVQGLLVQCLSINWQLV